MSDTKQKSVPVLLWPFYALWRFLTLVLNIVGRLLCSILGFGLMIAGVLVTLSVVGAPLGIPLLLFGFLLMVRAIF